MTLLAEQRALVLVVAVTAPMWPAYTLALILRGGVMAAMGNSDARPALPAWAERAKSTRANAAENQVLFAPAVLVSTFVNPDAPTVVTSAHIYPITRPVHYSAYVAGVPVVRTPTFVTGWGATLVILGAALS